MGIEVKPAKYNQLLTIAKAWTNWVPTIAGLCGFIIIAVAPKNPVGFALVWIFGLAAAAVFSVVLHELAHAGVAVLVGLRPIRISLGRGAKLAEKRIGGIKWVFNSVPSEGYVLALQPKLPWLRTRLFLFTLAGPLINVILLIIAGASLVALPLWFDLLPGLLAFMVCLIVVNVIFLPVSLWPQRVRIQDCGYVPNDGLLLVRTPFLEESELERTRASIQYIHAIEMTQEGAARITARGSACSPSLYWKYLLQEITVADFLLAMRWILDQPGLSTELRNHALDSFCTFVLFQGATDQLDEAERYSGELLRNQPDAWSIKGTRGCILVEKGDLTVGMSLLSEVIENDPNPSDRAISACFLALGEIKQKQFAKARAWLETARGLDADCVPLTRVETLLRSQAG